jgi:chloramphenicol-sensitive protein RarD
MQIQRSEYGKGLFYGVISYLTWGLFPLYWKMLEHVSSVEILCHRIIWSCVFMFIFFRWAKKYTFKQYISSTKQYLSLLFTGTLMTLNWGLYIWAINHHYIVESSLGYYINPLFSVLFASVFLKEKLNKAQKIGILFALVGVLYFTFDYGRFPIISLVLATSFAIYGLMKKKMRIDATAALTVETLWMMPMALVYVFFLCANGDSALNTLNPATVFLLVFAGVVTALPLLWFGKAAERIPLSVLGFLQYLSPTLQLLLGVVLYGEKFSSSHVVCFSCIWLGLMVYSVDIVRSVRKSKKNIAKLEVSK